MESEVSNPRIDIPTLIAISIIAWVLTVSLHEIIGHAIPAALMGLLVRVVTTTNADIPSSQISADMWRSGTWRIIPAGGTIVNLMTGAISCLLLHFLKRMSKALQYFLWLFATFSFTVVIMNLVTATAIGSGDWIDFTQELVLRKLYIGIIIGIGILIAMPCYALPLREFMPDLKGNRLSLLKVTAIPVLALTIIQILSVFRSPYSRQSQDVTHLIYPIFVLLHFIIWVTLVNLVPVPRSSKGIEVISLGRSYFWIVFGIIAGFVFVLILGKGLGPI